VVSQPPLSQSLWAAHGLFLFWCGWHWFAVSQ
jgi:hypothetical protein